MSKCWYCNNELTTGDNPKHFGICNKCYDEMFKSSDTIIHSFANKIVELKQQLEDAEEHIDDLELQLREQYQIVDEKDQQLAKKEKMLERIMSGEYIPANIAEKSLELSNQDKISFAIEQLEKVKKFFLEEHRDEEMDTDYIITKDAGQIADYLLDQIKQLKEDQHEARNS